MERDAERQKQHVEMLEQQFVERTIALQMLCDVATIANQQQNVEDALELCLRRVAEYAGWSLGHAYIPSNEDSDVLLPARVWYAMDAERLQPFAEQTFKTSFRRGERQVGMTFGSGMPQWSRSPADVLDSQRAELAKRLELTTAATFPVMVEDRVVGVLEFFAEKDIDATPELFRIMASVGMQLGRVIGRKAFQDRLLMLSEEEHRRIGQELHDDVGQELTGLALKVETLVEMLGGEDTPVTRLAHVIAGAVDRIRAKSRTLSRGLVPVEVDGPGLIGALEELAYQVSEGSRLSCTFRHYGGQPCGDGRTASQLYRIAREAVANAMEHEQTANVGIVFHNDDGSTSLEICDDGPGLLSGMRRRDGVGLQIMRYRASLIGAKLDIEACATGGARVTCRLPKQNG